MKYWLIGVGVVCIATFGYLTGLAVETPPDGWWEEVGSVGTVALTLVTCVYVGLVYGQLQEARRLRVRTRDEGAAERAVRCIKASKIRVGEPTRADLGDYEVARALYDGLELEGQVLSDPVLRNRISASRVFIMWNWKSDRELDEQSVNKRELRNATTFLLEQCEGQLYCFWRDEPLPPWPKEVPDVDSAVAAVGRLGDRVRTTAAKRWYDVD